MSFLLGLHHRTRRAGTLVLAVVLSLAGTCLAQEPLAKIKIALSSNNMALAPVRIAEQSGIFKKHGVESEIVILDSANAAMAAIISGAAQVGAPGLSEVLIARARGQRVVVIANVIRGLSMSLVVRKAVADQAGLKPDSPLPARLRALEGLNVALPSATSPSVAAFRGAASTVGANFKSVYMSQPAMVAALETGAIDAMVAGPPNWFGSVAKGSAFVWVSAPRGEIPAKFNTASSACLQAMEDYAKANPRVIRGIRAAMVEVAKLMAEKPEDVRRFMAKAYPQVDAASIQMVIDSMGPAWSQPLMTVDDIRNEFEVIKGSGMNIPGLERIDPRALVEF